MDEHYKSKEALLEYVSNQRTSIDAGDTDTSENVRRTIQDTTNIDARNETTRRGKTQTFSRGDGSSKNFQGSTSRFIDQFRVIDTELTGGNSSDYKRSEPDGGYRRRDSWGDRVKNAFKPFSEAFKPTKTVTAKKSPAKKEYRKLSDVEVIKLKKPLVEVLLWTSEHLDEFIIATTKGHDETIEIWSNIDKDDAEIIADFLLSYGKVSIGTARLIRQAVALKDRVKLLMIVAPRLYRTFTIYVERGVSVR